MIVPFKKPYFDNHECDNVRNALLGGMDYLNEAKALLEKHFDTNEIFLTSTGSTAIDLLFFALDLPPGSEVIMPSFTFPSCANTLLRAGLKPVFAEISADTLTLDIDDVTARITSHTRCIVPTHYGGVSCDLDVIKEQGILIVEDAALSYNAFYKGKPLGTVGDMGVLSFHHTKNISSDQGGALLVNKEDPDLLRKLNMIYENGTNKTDYLCGRTPNYQWQQPGMNPKMPNICAAVLAAQLEKANGLTEKQRHITRFYRNHLSEAAKSGAFDLGHIPEYNRDNGHIFYMVFRDAALRERIRNALASHGICANFHYMPLHASPMGQKLGYRPEDLPITQDISARILRLPVYAELSDAQCEEVVGRIREVL